MTFEEILNAAYDDQGYQSFRSPQPPGNTPAADVVSRFQRWANEGVRDILGRPRIAPLRHVTVEFMSEPGLPIYGLGESIDAIDTIVQQTQDRRLRNMTRDWYRSIDPGERSEGTPWAWIEEGYRPVQRQPNGTRVWIMSFDPAANATVTMRALGTDLVVATAVLAGQTFVPLSTGPETFDTILSLSLSKPVGKLCVLWDADAGDPNGHQLAGILAGQTSTQYHTFRLWPTPTAAERYTVDGQLKILPMVDPNDVPMLIPALHHIALVDYINYRAYEKNGDSARAQVCRANYERRIGELTNKFEFSADFRPVRGGLGPDARRWTNLPGGNYPADGWGR